MTTTLMCGSNFRARLLPEWSASDPRLAAKARQLAAAEKIQPLRAYRDAELAQMHRNFFDPGEPYPQLRRAFVYKDRPARTPVHLARHRTGRRSAA